MRDTIALIVHPRYPKGMAVPQTRTSLRDQVNSLHRF